MGFLVTAANRQGPARTIVLTLPAEVKALRPRTQTARNEARRKPPGVRKPPELVTIRQRLGTKNPRKTLELSCTTGPDIDRI
jgi:hypothetical protein